MSSISPDRSNAICNSETLPECNYSCICCTCCYPWNYLCAARHSPFFLHPAKFQGYERMFSSKIYMQSDFIFSIFSSTCPIMEVGRSPREPSTYLGVRLFQHWACVSQTSFILLWGKQLFPVELSVWYGNWLSSKEADGCISVLDFCWILC